MAHKLLPKRASNNLEKAAKGFEVKENSYVLSEAFCPLRIFGEDSAS